MIDFCGEEIQRCKDASVGAKVVLLHDFFVVYRVADVDVGGEWDIADRGVEVQDVGRGTLGV